MDYDNQDSLDNALSGVHTLVSTVTGLNQVSLLSSALRVGVRRFIPAEFEGALDSRTQDDILDRGFYGKHHIRTTLQLCAGSIHSTIISCGVLYERFAPGGLRKSRLGLSID